MDRQREVEGASPSERAFRPDPAAVSVHDAFGDIEAEPYPSKINVSGFNEGSIRDVNLSLKGFAHTCPSDVDVLLVGPQGQKAVVMSSVGGCADIRGVNLTLDDEATKCLPYNRKITSGTYRPTQWRHCDGGLMDEWEFPSPAPAGPYDTTLSAFDGTVSGVRFRYITLGLEHDIQETGANSASYPFRTSLDFIVVFDN